MLVFVFLFILRLTVQGSFLPTVPDASPMIFISPFLACFHRCTRSVSTWTASRSCRRCVTGPGSRPRFSLVHSATRCSQIPPASSNIEAAQLSAFSLVHRFSFKASVHVAYCAVPSHSVCTHARRLFPRAGDQVRTESKPAIN